MSSLPPNDNRDSNNPKKRSQVDNTAQSAVKKSSSHRKCLACGVWHHMDSYSDNQWGKGEGYSRCKPCITLEQQRPKVPIRRSKCQNCGSERALKCFLQDDKKTCIRCLFDSAPIRCSDCGVWITQQQERVIERCCLFGPRQPNPYDTFTPMTVAELHAVAQRNQNEQCDNCKRARREELYAEQPIAEEDLHTNRNKKCCTECEQWLTPVEYSEDQWNSVEKNVRKCKSCSREPKTTHVPQWLLDSRQREERWAREARELKLIHRKHGIFFYNAEVLWATRFTEDSRSVSTCDGDVVGEYDIVFLSTARCGCQEGDQRTMKGKARFKLSSSTANEGDESERALTGVITFHEALPENPLKGGIWIDKITLEADQPNRLKVAFDNFPEVEDDAQGSMRRVTRRFALPRRRHEELDEEDAKAGDIVEFDSLEQAEALARQYESGPDALNSWMTRPEFLGTETLAKNVLEFLWIRQPKPIFFVEPEDLLVLVRWTDENDRGFDGPDCCEYVLRRRDFVPPMNE